MDLESVYAGSPQSVQEAVDKHNNEDLFFPSCNTYRRYSQHTATKVLLHIRSVRRAEENLEALIGLTWTVCRPKPQRLQGGGIEH
eukprot:2546187-Amphidinium_carterae.1